MRIGGWQRLYSWVAYRLRLCFTQTVGHSSPSLSFPLATRYLLLTRASFINFGMEGHGFSRAAKMSTQLRSFSPRLPRCALRPFMKHALVSQRLPEFEAVAVAVLDPGEAAVAGVLALGIDPDSGGSKLGEQSVEVVDAVVDHGGL